MSINEQETTITDVIKALRSLNEASFSLEIAEYSDNWDPLAQELSDMNDAEEDFKKIFNAYITQQVKEVLYSREDSQ